MVKETILRCDLCGSREKVDSRDMDKVIIDKGELRLWSEELDICEKCINIILANRVLITEYRTYTGVGSDSYESNYVLESPNKLD